MFKLRFFDNDYSESNRLSVARAVAMRCMGRLRSLCVRPTRPPAVTVLTCMMQHSYRATNQLTDRLFATVNNIDKQLRTATIDKTCMQSI